MAEREALREALMNIAALTPETNANRNCTCTSCEARRIALAALTHAPAPASEGVREEKLKLFLSILEGAGGETSGNDGKWNWINYFCDDAEPLDTFNQASARKLTRVTHDSDADDSVVYLTDAGRAFISPADTVEPDDGEDHLGERR